MPATSAMAVAGVKSEQNRLMSNPQTTDTPESHREAPQAIEHAGEPLGNALRGRLYDVEPIGQRTYTPSLAVIDRSAGAFHWTVDGRKLADFTSGVLVANLGHNPVRWWQRVLDELGLGALATAGQGDSAFSAAVPLCAYNAGTELETRATERLLANLRAQPGGGRFEQILWAASGSEAIQKALWAALAARRGHDCVIVATRHGFHGKKGLAGAVTGSESDADRDPRVRFISFPMQECATVAQRNGPLDLAPYEQELSALQAACGSRLCCLITEPYLGAAGSYHPQPEYLQLLERFCRENEMLFILDEVQSNFGRTGPMYAFAHYGLEPDIVVLGKGLGNGVPVAALAGPEESLAALKYGEGSDTWSGNSLACAAVVATLDEFEANDILAHAARLAGVLERGLLRIEELDAVARVRGEGVVWGVECAAVGRHSADDVAVACVEACYRGDERGRAIHLLGPLAGRVLRVSPPLTMALDDAEDYLDAMYDIIRGLGKELAS